MSAEDLWFRDTGMLLDELRQIDPESVTPTIEGYADLVEVGRGGQGVVYRATQLSTGRTIAVKVLLDGAFASASNSRRFEREIELVAGLRHPNIVRIYDSGATKDGRRFFSMELIDGSSFDVFAEGLRGQRSGRAQLLETFAKVCDAVAHAHQRGVIHRDLKPGNIRVDSAAGPHVLDFGLAKPSETGAPGADGSFGLSVTGQFLGSLPWASPELATGDAAGTDVRSDIYALGMILYSALTGRFPYEVSGVLRDVLDAIARTEPTRPSLIDRSIDNDLETIVLRCLAKDPARRYQSAAELASEVRRLLAGEPIEAKRDSALYVLRKTLARRPAVTTASVLAVVAVVVFAVTMTLLFNRALRAERLAEARLAETRAESLKVATVNEYLLGAFTPRAGDPGRTVQEMLDAAAGRVGVEIEGQPAVRAEVHNALGYWFSAYGRGEDAQEQRRLTLHYRAEAYGEDSEELIDSHRQLSIAAGGAGDFDAALHHADAWRRLLTTHRSGDQLGRASVAGWLAELFVRAGSPSLAVEAARRALDLRAQNLEAGDPLLALTEGLLGITLAADDRFEEADAMVAQAYAAAADQLGSQHRNVVWLRGFVDETYAKTGRPSPIQDRDSTRRPGS